MEPGRHLTVKALTKYIKRKFDADPHLKNVSVKGELSNVKHHSSGHLYFTLKDDSARIMAVMFAASARHLAFRPENGMEVILTGDATVYESSGQYQLYVKTMQQEGAGNLFAAFEQLKKKLEQEGLFRPEAKRRVPAYPSVIAVVTSPTGAAIRDILTTINRRYPSAEVLIYPALVQGERAPESIVRQLQKVNQDGRADVVIAGRGGGSIEELWAFNEEAVARAIRSSKVPVISAVGHETDFTIADFAADLRAPTPTAAAEMAVPHVEEVSERIKAKESRLMRAASEMVRSSRNRHQAVMNSYVMRNPEALYRQQFERADRLHEQLIRSTNALIDRKKTTVQHASFRLSRTGPGPRIAYETEQLEKLKKSLYRLTQSIVNEKKSTFGRHIAMLEALSPLKVMERGYSLVYSEEKELIKTVQDVQQGDRIHVQMADGTIYAQVDSIGRNKDET
ncbi:exodeoxyribonuclease VII large subunit [Domibacillus indicus]|uniref:exodeoxyribonuclease VII large subunit n=1 Tax=Domibacillus TaxID=1433999 RepID=UPI00204014D5|nr:MULTISPECIES: exodeoxyribonuclease VII large subunit [Domibacillus]MCM3788384.1 exodeoxyribonuclease VII large subunit [Domibacillus indicus]WNS81997.1 exodeoxyribonuclease VII large subunit [Domibacillus sp. DTU_2020_1001157_1_SI_ALB_TIR_016]